MDDLPDINEANAALGRAIARLEQNPVGGLPDIEEANAALAERELSDVEEENAALAGGELPDIEEENAALAGGELPDIEEANEALRAARLKIGFNEMAGLNYEAATGADAPENGLLRHLVNINSIGARGFAAGQMSAAQSLADGSDRGDADTNLLLSRMIGGTIGGTVASWFSTPDELEYWDRHEGAKIADPAARTKARNAYAAEIARQFIKDRVQTQSDAGTELQTREATFGAQALADLEQNVGYMVPFALGPVGIAAQFAASGWGKAEELASDTYAFDDDGNLVVTAKGDSAGKAIVKGLARAGVETGVELVGGKIVGGLLKKIGGKALGMAAGRFPVAQRVADRIVATPVGKAVANAATKLNRLTALASRKLHIDGLAEEYLEEWLDPTIAEALGVERRRSEQKGTNPLGRAWEAQKEFFTLDNQQRLVTSLILLQGAGNFAAWCAERGRMNVVDDYLKRNGLMTDEQIKSASAEDKAAAMDRHVRGMDEAEVKDTLDKTAETAEGAAKSVEQEVAAKENAEGAAKEDGTGEASAAGSEEAAARRESVRKVRAEQTVAGQVAGVEELGVTSWKQAEAEGLVERDAFGRLEGGARQAVTIALEATDRLKEAVKRGEADGDLAEELIAASKCELGGRPKSERDAFVDGILDRAGGDAAMARRMLAEVEARERTVGASEGGVDAALDEVAERVKAESIAKRNGLSEEDGMSAAQTAVETADGEMKTLGEVASVEWTGAAQPPRAPETALDGVEQAGRLGGAKIRPTGDGLFTCERFKSMLVMVDERGVWVSGLSADMLSKPENAADAAAVIAQLGRIAAGSGVKVNFGETDAAAAAAALAREVNSQGLARTQRKLDLRARLFGVLMETGLAADVTTDEKSFREALANSSNGRQFIDSHGNIYGFAGVDGKLHFNPAGLSLDTPIHEYGHLALEFVRKANNALWRRGMDLVRESQYFQDIKKASQTEGHEYEYLNGRDEEIADEALATMIGDRGAKLVAERGLDAKLKAWLKEVWAAFKGAFGLADLTAEQVEKMTLGQFVDAVNAELLKGSEFGARKRPPSKASVKAYDETSRDSNGLLRWVRERGCLFKIPVDRERTQPGGKVFLATDNADVTDWIARALHGVDLRMSEGGKIYVKGRNGLDGDLAAVFGRYPQAGENDGVFGEAAAATGHAEHEGTGDPQALVDALLKDRDSYRAWKRSGGLDAEDRMATEREEWEARQAEDEARQRWEDSGMSVVDYVKSRVEEGDPDFDLDWETAREIAYYEALALKEAEDIVPYEGDVPFHAKMSVARVGRENVALVTDIEGASRINAKDPHSVERYVLGHLEDNIEMLAGGNASITRESARHFAWSKVRSVGGRQLRQARAKSATVIRDLISLFSADETTRQAKDGKGGTAWRCRLPVGVPKVERGRVVGGVVYDADVILKDDGKGKFFYDVSHLKKNEALTRQLSNQAEALVGAKSTAITQERAGSASGASSADSVSNRGEDRKGGAKFAVEGGNVLDESLFAFNPDTETAFAMGETEQRPSGIAAGIERAAALRPWTAEESPAAKADPIAFDAADLVALWRAVSGSTRNPHVQKGERIKGRKSAVGMNVGGERIEIVSRLFGVLDRSDVAKIRSEMKDEGYFRQEDPTWNGRRSRLAISQEAERSNGELDRRVRELYERRVRTGEGGGHYAAQVLGHEIGHTIANLPRDRPLGPVGDSLRTLFDAVNREFKKAASPLRKPGDLTVDEETRALIAWWHGQEEMPAYYEKDTERFAELFGIFLTQPKSVAERAPKTYAKIVKTVAENERLARAYAKVASLKWSGKSTDAFMEKVRETWNAEAQAQYRDLVSKSQESLSLKRDRFTYALNDRFGPMFNVAKRGIKAARKLLDQAVREGRMSRAEADDRIAAQEAQVDALKTSLYDWQRQSGGQTRLMIAGFEGVKSKAERDGVDWSNVRDYAHCARVIELGGRATAHGGGPARTAHAIELMRKRLGAEGFAKVERTWNAFRAVYERSVLGDPNVKELFDAETNKMLMEKRHYVTMKHRMGVEEAADWAAKVEAYRRDNPDAIDPFIDMGTRLHKGLGAPGEGSQGFVLHRLVGSFEATEDPIAATIRRAIEIKESAARNLKQASETLRACGVRGVFDLTDGEPHQVDGAVYGKLKYMLDGQAHELIVPSVIYKSVTTGSNGFGKFGEAMRFLRNTMTLWNPAFINRAYLVDKGSLETNVEGLHKPVVDVISEALCFRGVGVPLYLANNYLTRFTPLAETWLGRVLWNEHTVNHYAHRAQKIARIVYEGKFDERLAEAQALRERGLTADAAAIEQDVAVAEEMLKRNVFQSQYQFNREQAGMNTDDILAGYGYRLKGGAKPTTALGKAKEMAKAAGRWLNRFEEEQEAVMKIVAYLYRMKADEKAGRTSEADAAARARLVIEQGGTPNLAARGVMASYIENATGFFWNVRKEGALRTLRALKDHPAEWLTKNLVQTAAPAVLKALMLTGGLEWLIRAFFGDDDEKVKESWWAPAVIEHARWTADAMKCVPGYYQRNYNVIPLAKFGDEVVSLRVKYSPEEFALQELVHTAFQKLGQDPTDPSADWSTLSAGVWNEFFPNIFGRNYLFDTLGTVVGPLVGFNPYDNYRERKFYDETTWKARGLNAYTAKEIGKKFWNYSPLGTFTSTFKDGQERKLDDSEVPAWLDSVLSAPLVRMIPASMLTVTSKDSYLKGLKEKDDERRALARVKARDVLAESIRRGSLGGFREGLKDLPPHLQRVAIRHVINGWRQYKMDPRAKALRNARRMKDPQLRQRALEWISDGMRYGD